MIFDVTGKCHNCGEPGEIVVATGAQRGVPWCSAKCERTATFKQGDTVVLDSGYTPGENGIPFKVKKKVGEDCYGSVRGKPVRFHVSMAAKMGTKRAEAIINQRKLLNARQANK
jgi:hypothetical protein